jgi:hypothetical protein
MPVSMPFIFFGHVFTGATPKVLLGLIGLATGGAGFGMLKLKPWAFYAMLVMQSVFLVNGVLTILTPGLQSVMHEALTKINDQNPAFPAGNPFVSDYFFRYIMIFSMFFIAAVIAILLFQRSRFLDAAKQAANS